MRITSKGQITIPKSIRQRTGMHPGANVEFDARGDEVVLRKAHREAGPRAAGRTEFEAYLDRVTGIVELGMSTDEFMEVMRGE